MTATAESEIAEKAATQPRRRLTELQTQFKKARSISTPLIAIRTPDPAHTMKQLTAVIGESAPILGWDIAQGIYWKNDAGLEAVWHSLMLKEETDPVPDTEAGKLAVKTEIGPVTQNPFEAVLMAQRLPSGSVLFAANMQTVLAKDDGYATIQAIWNLRDIFKTNKRSLVMTCPDIKFPPELAQDVLMLDEPLPNPQELAELVKRECGNAGVFRVENDGTKETVVPQNVLDQAVDAMVGLAAFPAETAIAMSLKKSVGIDLPALILRTSQTINSTKGLEVNKSKATFDDLGGLSNIKSFLTRLCNGRKRPRIFVRVEEIEKLMAGKNDLNGIGAEYLKAVLTFMQDKMASGLIAVGVPGSGKSEISNAVGNTFGKRVINCDMDAMKGGLVGQSQEQLNYALKVLSSASLDELYFIATCNSLDNIPSELKRRYKNGIWFFDLPTESEQEPIWQIMLKRYGVPDQERPNYKGWTGSEIQTCVENAWMLDCTLIESSQYVIPISKSDPKIISGLREQADGRWLSASYPGPYRKAGYTPTEETGSRRIDLEEEAS